MGSMMLAGCILVGFSVPAIIFLMIICRRPQLVIVLVLAAFFWLLSLLISAIFWFIIPPIAESNWAIIPIGTIISELFRYLFIRLYSKSERSFSVVSINAIVFPLTDLYSAISAGIGYSIMHSFLFYGIIISHSLGPGSLFTPVCTAYSQFFISSWSSLLFTLLHIQLMIIAFDSYRNKSILKYSIVIILHLAAAGLTILNTITDGCKLSLPLIAVIVAISWCIGLIIIHQNNYRSKRKV